MKRVVFILLMTMILIPSGIARKLVAEGNTFTKFGNYKIEIADNAYVLSGKEHLTYLITYENTGFTVKIIVDKMKYGTRLLAVSDALSVQYLSHQNFFGVEKIDRKYSEAGLSTSDAALNRYEYFHQKLISPWEVNDLDKIKLVAAYYPALINNMENLLTAK
jgi:hypothetical protein